MHAPVLCWLQPIQPRLRRLRNDAKSLPQAMSAGLETDAWDAGNASWDQRFSRLATHCALR
jgi:hypothetical protein